MDGTGIKTDGRFWRKVGKSVLLIVLSAALGTGLLVLSEFMPAEPMDRNLARSADIFQVTGKFPNLHTWCSSRKLSRIICLASLGCVFLTALVFMIPFDENYTAYDQDAILQIWNFITLKAIR